MSNLALELADLDLPSPRTRGRATKPLRAEIERELTADDLNSRSIEAATKAEPLRKLTQRHHRLAQLLASGVKPSEAAVVVGYAASTVSILMTDPSFKELVNFYSVQTEELVFDTQQQLKSLVSAATAEMLTRIEDDPDSVSDGTLKDVITLGADRTGHGPASSNTTLNVHANMADRLGAARKRVAAMKDITPPQEIDDA